METQEWIVQPKNHPSDISIVRKFYKSKNDDIMNIAKKAYRDIKSYVYDGKIKLTNVSTGEMFFFDLSKWNVPIGRPAAYQFKRAHDYDRKGYSPIRKNKDKIKCEI